jgi:hypothetical protein
MMRHKYRAKGENMKKNVKANPTEAEMEVLQILWQIIL